MVIRIKNSLDLGGLLPGRVTRDALGDGAEHIKEVSQGQVPVLVDVERANRQEKPGTLRDSAYARVVDDVTAEIGYTDFAAGWQHERMDYHHDIGKAKFLEDPLTTEKDATLQIIAARMREGLGG